MLGNTWTHKESEWKIFGGYKITEEGARTGGKRPMPLLVLNWLSVNVTCNGSNQEEHFTYSFVIIYEYSWNLLIIQSTNEKITRFFL